MATTTGTRAKRKRDAEWDTFVRERGRRKKKQQQPPPPLKLVDVLHQIPDIWCCLDPRSMQNLVATCKRASEDMPLSLIRQMAPYERACLQRYKLSGMMRRRTLMDKFHAHVLNRSENNGQNWNLNVHMKSHRRTLHSGLTLLTAQPKTRPDPHLTQHFCFECRKVVQTNDIICNPHDYIQVEQGLVSEQFLCRAFFPDPVVRRQINTNKFSPTYHGFHDKPHLCRQCAVQHDYIDIDAYCAEYSLPSWTFSLLWRREFGVVVSLMPLTSPFHNGRFAPRRLLDKTSCNFRRFVQPRRLADIPLADLCSWNDPLIAE